MFLMKLRKPGKPVDWGLVQDGDSERTMNRWVALGYAVAMVKLDESDTHRLVDPDLLTNEQR